MATSCAACSKVAPRPTLICAKCSEGVDVEGEPQPTHYCTALCRDRDQGVHKSDCEKANRRKQVYRAASILQETLTRFRNRFFDMNIGRIEKRGEVIYMYDGDDDNNNDSSFFRPPVTSPSPQLSSDDIRAVLMYCACGDPSEYFFEFGMKLVSDVALHVEEVITCVDESFCKTKRCSSNGKLGRDYTDHEVLAIDTVDGDTFIIDVTGSQFGQHRAVLTLQEFIRTYRDPTIDKVRQYGHAKSISRPRLAARIKKPGQDLRAEVFQAYAAQAFNKAISLWEQKTNISVAELIRTSGNAYTTRKNKLLDSAFDTMNSTFSTRMRDFIGCEIEKVLPILDYTQPMRDRTRLVLSKNPQGSAIHRHWVQQKMAKYKTLRPQLDNGGEIVLHLTGGEHYE